VKVVQTLMVRDEIDIIDAQIAYHLNAGVDFVIANDHDSRDGTTEVLESYASQGVLRRIPRSGAMLEGPWRTHMARLAATEHGADWVINTDADEFWIAPEGTLKDALAAVPDRYGVVWALTRHFVPRPEVEPSFAERMTVRVSSAAPINDPASPYRPHAKVAHRGDPEVVVRYGAHLVVSQLRPLVDWYVADAFHFPYRSLDQYLRKSLRRAHAVVDEHLGQYVRALNAHETGRAENVFGSFVIDDAALERGLRAGSLAVDTRLRDALRARERDGATTSRPESASVGDVARIVEAAALRDADVVRLSRRLDDLSARIAAVERGAR